MSAEATPYGNRLVVGYGMTESMVCKLADIACGMGSIGHSLDVLALAFIAAVSWIFGVAGGSGGGDVSSWSDGGCSGDGGD